MNREILKAKIAEAISSTNTSGNEKLEAILAAVDTYSSAGNGTKPNVSGALPLDDETVSEPIQNALYAAGFNTDQCENLAEGILLYMKDYGFMVVRQ